MLKIIKSQQGGNTLSKLQRSTERQCYTMLALPLIGFFVFTLYPMGWAISKAFYYFNNIPNETKYVGLKNFVDIFTRDAVFWKTWVTTFEFALLKLPFEVPMALVLAVLLSKINKGKSLFRTAYFVPSVIATSLSAVIFNNLFQYFGFFNDILMKLGLIAKPIDWYANRGFAMIMLVIGSVWSSFGINVLYFTAALSNVPKDVYEAASLDGAGPVQSFFHHHPYDCARFSNNPPAGYQWYSSHGGVRASNDRRRSRKPDTYIGILYFCKLRSWLCGAKSEYRIRLCAFLGQRCYFRAGSNSV